MFNVLGLHGVRENVYRMPLRKEIETMFWLKCCPWCGGDLFSGTDLFGHYITCFQCSRDLNEADVAAMISRRTVKVQTQTGPHGANEACRLNLWQPGRSARLPEFSSRAPKILNPQTAQSL